jgi:DNA-binding NtrC family response regulator
MSSDMVVLDAVLTRLPIVLVVDPVVASRFAMWRALSHCFGVLEAPDARHARTWLTCGRNIDALIVQSELPDADGSEFVKSLVAEHVAASRALLVTRPVDLRMVVTRLAGWFVTRELRKAAALRREADRLVS